ncbi:MAG: hypothetical protein JNM99_18690 [Verrucomicrobiaceae bacterium]|nr:hypothetical protein [Verrucomicrobiaceae bacterium]
MNTVTLFSFALHTLVIAGIGWLLVRWGLRDARHRSWAALVMALSALLQPLAFTLGRGPATPDIQEAAIADPVPAWKPEWTVKLAPVRPAPILMEQATVDAPRFDWRDHLDDALGIWLSGTLVLGLVHAARSWRAWRWRKGLRRGTRAGVWVFDGDGGPCVVGLWRPVIAVPQSVHEAWTEDQWRWLMAHEGEHVRERDPLMAWLLSWVRACLWWNPFVHSLISHWSQAREEVCDAVAVARTDDSERYASFLVDIASRGSRSFAIAMAASRPARRLRARLLALLERRPVRERLSWGFRSVMAVIFATGTVLVSCVGVEQPEDPPLSSTGVETRSSSTLQLTTKFVKWKDFEAQIRRQLEDGGTLNDGRPEELGDREGASITTKSGEVIEFIRVPGPEQMVTRAFKVAPDFLTRLAGNRQTAKQGLEARGIKFWQGATVVFNPTTSQLIVKHSPATLRKIAALIDQVQQGQTQVYLQSKLIEAPELLGKDGATMQEAEYQSLLKAASQKKGFDLLSAPSITTRLGQQATVEVSKERGQSDDFVGLRIELEPELGTKGTLKLQSHVVIAHEFTPDTSTLHNLSKPVNEIDWPKVKRWEHRTTSTLKHGETAVIHLGETQKGRFVTVFITAKALLPTGENAKEFSATIPTSHHADEPNPSTNGVVAVVDGRVITKSDVRDFVSYERLRLAHVYRDNPRKADPEMKKLEAQATDLLVQRLTSISDYFRYAKDAELNKLIDQEVKAILGADEKAAAATLARGGLTLERFRWLAKASVIARALDDYRVGRLTTDAFKAINWPAKKVFISAKVVEVTSDDESFWLNFMTSNLATEAAKPGDQREESTKAENRTPALVPADPDGKPIVVAPGIMALTGIFTDPQFQVVMRALSQMKGMSLVSMPSASVNSAQAASMKAGAVECEVTPAIGADGYTIDLTIAVSEKLGGAGEPQQRKVSTAVTIWNGQTVVLGGRLSKDGEKPAHHRLIFVTAQLIKPQDEAK